VRVPVVNYALIGACAAAFVYQLGLGRELEAFVNAWGFVPAEVSRALEGAGDPGSALLSTFASMFLHAGWFHILGNLLYLRVFGDNVEDRFGHLGYLVFYALSGVAGALGQYLIDPASPVPMVGASGAIAGVLGAYIVLYPTARVLTVFPVFVVFTFIEVPAILFLGVWAAQQLLNGYLVLDARAVSGGEGGVAWFAHLGGFAFGLLAGLLGRLRSRRRRS